MRKASIGVAYEGIPFLLLLALSTLTFAALRIWPLALLCLGATWFCAHFFRDPERIVPMDPGLAVSPADGKVVRVEPREDPLTGETMTCVSVFMNVMNVHVNRAPIAGRLEIVRYYPGSFLNAVLDKASLDNERCAYLMRDDEGHPLVMVQVAGLLARRIVCRVRPGDTLLRGERYGMIRFGSRVDLFLPPAYTPVVAVGDEVFAGETVLARRFTQA